jgi:hypothetical protein
VCKDRNVFCYVLMYVQYNHTVRANSDKVTGTMYTEINVRYCFFGGWVVGWMIDVR